MTPEELNMSNDDNASSTVEQWSRRLGIPAATLLHHAGRDELKVFFIPPGIYTPRYVSTKDIDLGSYDSPKPPPVPATALTGSPYISGRLYGIYLEAARCAELSTAAQARVTFHTEMLQDTLPSIVAINSENNTWGRDLPSDARIVMFPVSAPDYFTEGEGEGEGEGKKITISQHIDKQAWNRSPEEYLRTPVSFLVRAGHVRIRDIDMADFLSRIRTFAFIQDMFDGKAIADSLPDFVSRKLAELIAANRLFWSESAGLNAEEREARRKEVLGYLSGDFKNHCIKQSSPMSLIKFAAASCDPHLVPQMAKISLAPSVTPSMLALLTASKLFWAASSTIGGTADPDKNVVITFLRSMGIKEKNGAEAGATLLKPESDARTTEATL